MMLEDSRKFHDWKDRVKKLTEKQYNQDRYGKPKLNTNLNPERKAEKVREHYRVKSPELQQKISDRDSVLSPERDRERYA